MIYNNEDKKIMDKEIMDKIFIIDMILRRFDNGGIQTYNIGILKNKVVMTYDDEIIVNFDISYFKYLTIQYILYKYLCKVFEEIML